MGRSHSEAAPYILVAKLSIRRNSGVIAQNYHIQLNSYLLSEHRRILAIRRGSGGTELRFIEESPQCQPLLCLIAPALLWFLLFLRVVLFRGLAVANPTKNEPSELIWSIINFL